jgi:hypothetical protein
MSTAFFPLGMNNNLNPQGYVHWKGINPIGSTPGTIRPLTNNDPTNNSSIGFGLPRPIKHARLGRDVSGQNRLSKSSSTGTLVKQMIDIPGGFTVAGGYNTVAQNERSTTANSGVGITIVSSNFLNKNNLTEKPPVGGGSIAQPPCYNVEANNAPSFSFCNPEKNARRRAMGASTVVNKKYFTRLEEYRVARCKTFVQNQAYFKNYDNDYTYSNTNPPVTDISFNEVGCPCVVYKPNNPQFCVQGAVDSSTRTFKLNVDTITTNAASLKNTAGAYANVVNQGGNPANSFIYKNKSTQCVKTRCVGPQ